MSAVVVGCCFAAAGGRGCGLQFALRDGRPFAVRGAWGTIAKWAGPVPSNRPVPAPTNGSVHADGTIGFHG